MYQIVCVQPKMFFLADLPVLSHICFDIKSLSLKRNHLDKSPNKHNDNQIDLVTFSLFYDLIQYVQYILDHLMR